MRHKEHTPQRKNKKSRPERKQKEKNGFWGKFLYYTIFAMFVYFGVSALTYADTLKFAHISDVHLSDKTVDTSYKVLSHSKELFDDEIKQINNVPDINFVIETGDLIDKSRQDLLLDAMSRINKLNAPWYFAFGNHDTIFGGTLTKDKYLKIIRKHNKNFKFDKPYYTFCPKKGYRVIVLDATINNAITANGKLPKEELEWLDEQLKDAQQKDELPLMFLHHPLHEPFPSFHHRLTNADEFKAVLDKHKIPMAIFSGHYHGTKIYKENNILHVSTPSLVSYPNAFRIVTITNLPKKIIFTFDFRETNLKDIQKKAKLLTFSSSTLKGEETDRNAVVVLDK